MVISTWSFALRGNAEVWRALYAGGSSLDAVEGVCRVVEADPEVDSVGRGGLPDRTGEVTVDAAIMLSPARSGSVCAVRRVLHPVTLARAVMEKTDHMMLAGPGAEALAQQEQMEGQTLLTDASRQAYEQWSAKPSDIDQSRDAQTAGESMRPIDSGRGGRLFDHDMNDEKRWKGHDTVGALALDSSGSLAGACSTSGTPFKAPGRVGDSPIVGHGLYVDPEHGAAVGTGTGELIMGVCGSFLAVEMVRRGAAPVDALGEVLERIAANYEIAAHHQAAFVVMTPSGEFAGAALRPGFKLAITTAERSEVLDPDLVLRDD